MGELLEAYGGTSCALAPDDAEPGMEMDGADLVQLAFSSAPDHIENIASESVGRIPRGSPALEALLVEVEEVRHYRGTRWDLPGGLEPRPN